MNLANFRNTVLSAALAASLTGCGGGGGTAAGGGTGGTGISAGVITGFGSVIVNDVHFNFDSANVNVNDTAGAGANKGLKVGMTVKVKGTFDANGTTGTATDIEAEHEVEGRIDTVNAADETFVVLGQIVRTDAQTLYDGIANGFSDLFSGMKVEVYGLRDARGDIHATLIELESDSEFEDELRGTVSDLTLATFTFKIGDLTIRYDNNTQFEHGMLMNDLKNGATVEVHLDISSTPPRATKIEFEDNEDSQFVAGEGWRAEVEGYVTNVVNSTTFEIGSQTVRTNTSTLYDGGQAGDIAVGRKVEAEGTISSGVLIARKIKFE